jgi:hypothetical protein
VLADVVPLLTRCACECHKMPENFCRELVNASIALISRSGGDVQLQP